MATSQETTPPRRVKKRILIPVILLVLMLGLFAWLYIRGTSADETERNPATAADGTVTHLFRDAKGNVLVRCAVIADAPIAKTWAVVTDYNHQADFLPYISSLTGTPEGDGRVTIVGVARSRIWGDWPYESHVTEKRQDPNGPHTITWDEKGDGELAISRGFWELRSLGENKTLIIYALQAETAHYPNFLVRNIIMDRLPSVIRAMRDEVKRRGA